MCLSNRLSYCFSIYKFTTIILPKQIFLVTKNFIFVIKTINLQC